MKVMKLKCGKSSLVLVSIGILSIGLLSVAALIGSTMNSGTNARYMNMANVLASEKLDI